MSNLAKRTVERIAASQEALGEHTGYIGATVFYDVESTAKCTHDDLEKHFERVNLSVALMPSLPSPRKVFSYVMARGAVGIADAQVLRISSEPSHELWGIYPVKVTGEDQPVMERDAELGEPLAKIAFFPESPQDPTQPLVVAAEDGVVTETPSNQVAANIIADWNYRRGLFTNPDLSEMIRSALKSFGRTRLKKSGHAYFVPAGRMDDMFKLQDVMSRIGGEETQMMVIPAAIHPSGLVHITTEARKGFEDDIRILREKIASFKDGTRDDTKDKTIQEAQRLKQTIELYRDISEDLVTSLQSDADDLVNTVRKMLGTSE